MATLTNASSSSSSHNWELCKENAAPLERGRNVAILSKALSSPKAEATKARKESDANIRQFEVLIRPSEKFAKNYLRKMELMNEHYSDKDMEPNRNVDVGIDINDLLERCKVDNDPIIHWTKYIKYHQETYPSDTHSQFLIMERCMHALFHIPKYKNDIRYIRVCVLCADKTSDHSDPHTQFKLLHKHKIGEEVAIFWLAWAWVAEKKGDFPFAEKIFNKALQKGAKPVNVVQERHKQFLRRMSRHWLNSAAEQQQLQQQQQQQRLGGEAVHVHSHAYRSVEEDDEDGENRRGALTGLTEEGVRQNNRARGVNTYQTTGSGTVGGILSTRNGHSNINQGAYNGVGAKPLFNVFSDENDADDHGYDLNQSAGHENDENQLPIPRIVRDKDRKKENTQSAEAWNQRGGLKNFGYSTGYDSDQDREVNSSVARRWAGTGSDSIIAGGTSSQQAFQVFVDEDCSKNNDDEKSDCISSARMKRTNCSSRGRGNERTLRQKLDDSSMARKPLRTMSSSSDESGSRGDSKRSSVKVSSSVTSRQQHTAKLNVLEMKSGLCEKTSIGRNSDEERCFEERRAATRCFKLVPAATNFNLLKQVDVESCDDDENSCMDIASSIEMVVVEEEDEDDHDDQDDLSHHITDENEPPRRKTSNILDVTTLHDRKAPLNVTTLHGTICDSIAKNSNPRKVLFDVNTSFENKSFVSAANNVSTASSVINESEAVGLYDDKEETVNTKFAARELSMMFSSPAPNSATANNHAMLSSKRSSSKLLFSVHRNKQHSHVDESNDSSTADFHDDAFSIFRDRENVATNDDKMNVFKIFEEASSQENSNSDSSNPTRLKGCDDSSDSSDSDSTEIGHEDEAEVAEATASLADIMDLMKEMGDNKNSSGGKKKESNKYEIFRESSNVEDSDDYRDISGFGEVDNDDITFGGDISCILHNKDGDTVNLQEKVRRLKISKHR